MRSQILPGLAQNGFPEFLEQNYTIIIIVFLVTIIAAGVPVLLKLWNRHKQTSLLYKVEKATAKLDIKGNNGSGVLSIDIQIKNICHNSIVVEALSARLVSRPGNEHIRKEVVECQPKAASPYRQPLPIGDTISLTALFEVKQAINVKRYNNALLVVRVTSAEILPYEKYHLMDLMK